MGVEDSNRMSRRDFLKSAGATAAGAAAGEMLPTDKTEAAEFGLGVDKLPEGVVKIAPEIFGSRESVSLAEILITASEMNLISMKLSLRDAARAESWQAKQLTGGDDIAYLEYKSNPGEFRWTRTRVDLSKVSALYINMKAFDIFMKWKKKRDERPEWKSQ